MFVSGVLSLCFLALILTCLDPILNLDLQKVSMLHGVYRRVTEKKWGRSGWGGRSGKVGEGYSGPDWRDGKSYLRRDSRRWVQEGFDFGLVGPAYPSFL
ncbi:hypothetical protein L208DRAFT_1413804 [Tricholoma matsutake]|nr:hypothetical protein L208DRAFT_1413804 [Tricholoma matsutake 945]